MRYVSPLLLSIALLSAAPANAWGQFGYGTQGAVPGMGTAKVKRLPEAIRLQMLISASGADAKAALARLQQKKQAAAKQLETLGAKKESVKFGDPGLDSGNDNQRRRMEMMIRQQRGGRGDPKKAPAPPVTVHATLSAEWGLSAKTPEEVLLAAADLQQKIKAADVAGAKGESELTPEQQELLEESGAADFDGQPDPATPIFLFVSPVSKEEHAKLLAAAFADAKAGAERTAAATGGKLGALRYVHGEAGRSALQNYVDRYGYGYDQHRRQTFEAPSPDQHEATALVPGHVVFEVNVEVGFDLAP